MPPSDKQIKTILARDAKVLGVIAKRKTGVGFSALESRTGLETNLLRGSINRLKRARKIQMAGASRSATYTVGAAPAKVKAAKTIKAKPAKKGVKAKRPKH